MSHRLYLIDGHGLCYRAFYAVKALSTSTGQPTNAVFGFCNILMKLLEDHKPTHVAVCFDVGKSTFRQEKFVDYKAHRQAMPDELHAQLQLIREVVQGYRLTMVEQQGYEADDMMASLAKRFAAEDTDVVIVTDDKDMGQMVSANIRLFSPRQEKFFGVHDIQEKFGVSPQQIPDWIGLAGDSSDNIPGVDGIGEVTARKLLTEYGGNIEALYQHIDEVKSVALKKKLMEGQEAALLSKELATVHADLPIDLTLEDLAVKEPDTGVLLPLFKKLEFKRFVAQIEGRQGLPETPSLAVLLKRATVEVSGRQIILVFDLKDCLKEKLITQEDIDAYEVFDIYLADYVLSGGQGAYDLNAARQDPETMKALYTLQRGLMEELGLVKLYQEIEFPLARILYHLEMNGVVVDPEVLAGLSRDCQAQIQDLEKILFACAGEQFNLNSPKQLSEILFEKLKLPVIKKTKTGNSTDEEVLNRLSTKHPLPKHILEYRQLAKLKSTYIDALPALIDPTSGRIHATFNQTGAETGRLSSTNPNLQNIPIRTDLGKQIRKAFVPYAPGHVLVSADYSQIELRVLAHLSKDPALAKAFEEDQDIHQYTASLMFDVKLDGVDKRMRDAAKRVNFGIIYGISAFGLAKDLDVSQRQAQEFMDRYFLRYPKVRDFMNLEIQKARDQGFVSTLFGRRRFLPEINNSNIGIRQFAERQAINTPVQGTAADMIKLAMVHIDAALSRKKYASTMILTVHDELVFDVPPQEFHDIVALVKTKMEHVIDLSIPIKASVKSGRNWLEMSVVNG